MGKKLRKLEIEYYLPPSQEQKNGIKMLYPATRVLVHHPSKPNMILLTQRTVNNKVYYEPAGGRVNVDFTKRTIESLEACAQREIQEELGVTVAIQGYVGSYNFFWMWAPEGTQKATICAVFDGIITDVDQDFTSNKDTTELPLTPTWISMHDILNESITIDSAFVGLEQLLKKYCHKNITVSYIKPEQSIQSDDFM